MEYESVKFPFAQPGHRVDSTVKTLPNHQCISFVCYISYRCARVARHPRNVSARCSHKPTTSPSKALHPGDGVWLSLACLYFICGP